MADRRPKLRGGRRYFRKLPAWPKSVRVQLGGRNWYDLWHVHPDFYGWSLRGPRAHRAHLEVLFGVFQRVLARLAESDLAGQVFVTVNSKDSPGDAIHRIRMQTTTRSTSQATRGLTSGCPACSSRSWILRPSRSDAPSSRARSCHVVTPRGPRGRPTRR